MPIEYRDWITRGMIRAEPHNLFVFGDNHRRVGFGGQAKEARGEPNSIGVATLWAPGEFFADEPTAFFFVVQDLSRVAYALADDKTVIVPSAGVGTGLAQLPARAPHIHEFIRSFFAAASGKPCPWE